MAAKSFFDTYEDNSEKEHEKNKERAGIESKAKVEKLNLSLPADAKDKFMSYCEKHYTKPSAQLRAWIDLYCNEE